MARPSVPFRMMARQPGSKVGHGLGLATEQIKRSTCYLRETGKGIGSMARGMTGKIPIEDAQTLSSQLIFDTVRRDASEALDRPWRC